MESEDSVAEYRQAMMTKLAIAYAAGLEVVHRCLTRIDVEKAMDLACGPGHNTMCYAKYLALGHVLGTDLSEQMVAAARENASSAGLGATVQFEVRNAAHVDESSAGTWDLVTFSHAAHHMPTMDVLSNVLRAMDCMAKPDGLVMVMDLVRLKTEKLNDRFVNVLGHDYIQRGLTHYFADFRNSMSASWTPSEMRSAIPKDSQRWWYQLVPRGLPTTQILLGLPIGRKQLFLRRGWGVKNHPLFLEWYPQWERQLGKKWARETLHDAKMLWMTLFHGHKRAIPTGASSND